MQPVILLESAQTRAWLNRNLERTLRRLACCLASPWALHCCCSSLLGRIVDTNDALPACLYDRDPQHIGRCRQPSEYPGEDV